MNADERRLKTLEVVPVPGSSSTALTDSFTSSNLLFILFIIGKVPTKAWRARYTRGKVAKCRSIALRFSSCRITRIASL